MEGKEASCRTTSTEAGSTVCPGAWEDRMERSKEGGKLFGAGRQGIGKGRKVKMLIINIRISLWWGKALIRFFQREGED